MYFQGPLNFIHVASSVMHKIHAFSRVFHAGGPLKIRFHWNKKSHIIFSAFHTTCESPSKNFKSKVKMEHPKAVGVCPYRQMVVAPVRTPIPTHFYGRMEVNNTTGMYPGGMMLCCYLCQVYLGFGRAPPPSSGLDTQLQGSPML